ncbi:MAG: nucleotidyltransferase family protein [Azospirillaceae bacterium]|nr:nucleotidyltransferase family protein [Azospirillaceae bacterium]
MVGPQAAAVPVAATSFETWCRFLELAGEAWLTTALDWRFRELGIAEAVPEDARTYAEGAAELGRIRTRRQCRQIRDLAALLNQTGLRPILLKGSAAHVTGLYPDPGARVCSDIDILLPAAEISTAVALLGQNGYAPGPGVHGQGVADPRHAPRLFHPAALFGVEIHHDLADRSHRAVLPAAEAIRGAMPLEIDGVSVSVLRLDHRVVHCLLHLLEDNFYNGTIALRQLLELRQLARGLSDPAWIGIAQRFHDAGAEADLEYGLLLASRLAGMPLPALRYRPQARLRAAIAATLFISAPGIAAVYGTARNVVLTLRRQGLPQTLRNVGHDGKPLRRGITTIRAVCRKSHQLS